MLARRARSLTTGIVVGHRPLLEVDPDLGGGVVVSLPLTHELLARLIGAQRPSVTTALGELAARGAVLRQEQRWILGGDLPDELERIYAGHPAPRLSPADGMFEGVGPARVSR